MIGIATVQTATVLLLLSPSAAARRATIPIETSICRIIENPSRFNGQIVRLRGKVFWGMENFSIYEDCASGERGGMVIEFPDDHPELKPGFHLVRDSAYDKFHYYLTAEPIVKPKLPPNSLSNTVLHRYCSMTVTITGRFYAVSEDEALHGKGYGSPGGSRSALVVKSVFDPVAEECPPTSGR